MIVCTLQSFCCFVLNGRPLSFSLFLCLSSLGFTLSQFHSLCNNIISLIISLLLHILVSSHSLRKRRKMIGRLRF
ncbi:hypothetical protein VNO78_27019 [Psophocarpus tetragonolobus]|uniref:Uncharacterized protein n=1 Tax=Psophocarpus tetragonolobus TaxID=3891 RepID=A0AAN9XBI6_PSOTE